MDRQLHHISIDWGEIIRPLPKPEIYPAENQSIQKSKCDKQLGRLKLRRQVVKRNSMELWLTLTVLVHRRHETFGQATCPALVAMRLVHRAAAFQVTGGLARVDPVAMDAALEETGTT